MHWLRRIVLLGLLSALAMSLLRRRSPQPSPAEGIVAEWPPLIVAATVGTASTLDGPTWKLAVNGACPDGHPIKVAGSGIYHVPGDRSYARTHPERCYARDEDAEADGYRRARL